MAGGEEKGVRRTERQAGKFRFRSGKANDARLRLPCRPPLVREIVLFYADFLTHIDQVALDTVELAQFFHRSVVTFGNFAERITVAHGSGLGALLGFRFACAFLSA